MSKGEKHGNREVRKPKKEKPKVVATGGGTKGNVVSDLPGPKDKK